MNEMQDGANTARRLYRLLLCAYPLKHRREYGEQLDQLFGDLYRDEKARKHIGLSFWMRMISDTGQSAAVEHVAAIREEGMNTYLQNYLHLNRWNLIGAFLLLPIFTMAVIDTITRLAPAGRNAIMENIYHSPLYYAPVLRTWVLVFPIIALILNALPLAVSVRKAEKGTSSLSLIRNNIATLIVFGAAACFLVVLKLHDFAPCVLHNLLKQGLSDIPGILGYCRNA